MLQIQFLQVPFITSVEGGQYLESLGIAITSSGLYEIPPYADDNFARYLTGFIRFVSGSGYWQGSGYSTQNSTYLLEAFSTYVSGYSTGAFLGSGSQFAGYALMTASGTGMVTLKSTLFTDTFSPYATGTYTGVNAPANFLYAGFTQSDYATLSGLTTGYVIDTRYSGSWTQVYFWENWMNYPTGYQYNPVFISGITTTQINVFTGYSGTNFYNTGTILSNVFGRTTGYCYTTGAYSGPQLSNSFVDNFGSSSGNQEFGIIFRVNYV